MFELCRAINEREACLGRALTTFFKADGTLTANPTMDDLFKLPCTGLNSLAQRNMTKITNAISGMCRAFTTTSGGATEYTTASLSAAVGGGLYDNPAKANEAAWWQKKQDALDLLIYAWGQVLAGTPTPVKTVSDYLGAGPTTFSEAYDDRYFQSYSSGSNELHVQVNIRLSPIKWASSEVSSVDWEYDSRYFYTRASGGSMVVAPNAPSGGTCVKTLLGYSISTDFLAATLSADIDTETISITGDDSGTLDITPFAVNASNTVPMSWTTPGTHPFTAPIGFDEDTRQVTVSIDDATMYLDLTSALTDQA